MLHPPLKGVFLPHPFHSHTLQHEHLHQDLLKNSKLTPHEIEHQMIELMMETMWQAQRDNCLPDDKAYLKKLKKLIK